MNNPKKKAAGLDALKNLSAPSDVIEEKEKTAPKPPRKTRTTNKTAPQKTSSQSEESPSPAPKDKVFSLHLPVEAHAKLRELSFHENISMTKLALEGIDMFFVKRGLPPLCKQSKDSK